MTSDRKRQAEAELAWREKVKPIRSSLLAFIQWTKPDYRANWHHRVMCEYFDRFVFGDLDRLMFFAPPRHGKSEIISRRGPAFILGHYPDARIIASSYSDGLANKMNRDVQRIMADQRYLAIFPDTQLGTPSQRDPLAKRVRNTKFFEVVGTDGSYQSAGVGVGITGMGAHFAIVDDPIKNREQADSPTYRDKVWDWYRNDLYTRLEGYGDFQRGKMLVTLTRWHEDDLAGRLLALAKSDPTADQWTVINLPALAESAQDYDPRAEGEALWPELHDIGALDQARATLGSRVFAALYQQRPAQLEGNLWKSGWFQYGYEIAPKLIDEVVVSVDPAATAKSTSDETGVTAACRMRNNDVILLNNKGVRLSPDGWGRLAVDWYYRYNANCVTVEPNNGGDMVRNTIKHIDPDVPVKDVWAKRGKALRAEPVAVLYENGRVWHAERFHELENQMVTFPSCAHDDRLDSAVYAVSYLTRNSKLNNLADLDWSGVTDFQRSNDPLSTIDW